MRSRTRKGEGTMKALIIYFSMSGYTRRVAEHIRDGILEEADQCDLKSLAEADSSSLVDYDLVGLGCPVYYYKEPFNVSDWIDGLPELKGKHWFVFCTHGSVMGKTLISMSERLKKKGILVIGYFHTYADATAPFFPYPVPTTGHPDPLEYEQSHAFGKEVVERSRGITQGEVDLLPTPDPVSDDWSQTADMLTRELLRQMMPPLRIDMEKCTLCHECEDSCPVKGIKVESDPPRIQNPCIYCFQCTMICPTAAIDADWELLRGFFPEDLFARYLEELAKAEAKGAFRWHIDLTSINLQDTQLEQRKRKLRGQTG